MRIGKLVVTFSKEVFAVKDRAIVLRNSSWFRYAAMDTTGFPNFYCTFSEAHAKTRGGTRKSVRARAHTHTHTHTTNLSC